MFGKQRDTQSWLKTMHTVMICALFFAQLQLKFIEYAYGNDYGKIASVKNSQQEVAKQKVEAKDTSSSASYTKLNKRYPINSLFVISSAANVVRVNYALLSLKIQYKKPYFTNHFHYPFSQRGPPSAC